MTRLAFALAASVLAAGDGLTQEADLSGRWTGRWESQTTRHAGPLRARFTRTDSSHYRVVFSGRFLGLVPFRYAQTLETTGVRGDAVFLAGTSRLPLFGTFAYRAVATGSAFDATFQSRRDRGTFTLRR